MQMAFSDQNKELGYIGQNVSYVRLSVPVTTF